MKSLRLADIKSVATRMVLAALLFMYTAPSANADTPGAAAAQAFVADLNRVILFPLIALLMGVAFLVFLVGCAEYVIGANNPSARQKGIQHITYGIIGLVVMVSAWGILSLATATFGLSLPQ